MGKTIPVIGVEPGELGWVRMLVHLLRHPDPSVPELARQALSYLSEAAGRRDVPQSVRLEPDRVVRNLTLPNDVW